MCIWRSESEGIPLPHQMGRNRPILLHEFELIPKRLSDTTPLFMFLKTPNCRDLPRDLEF